MYEAYLTKEQAENFLELKKATYSSICFRQLEKAEYWRVIGHSSDAQLAANLKSGYFYLLEIGNRKIARQIWANYNNYSSII